MKNYKLALIALLASCSISQAMIQFDKNWTANNSLFLLTKNSELFNFKAENLKKSLTIKELEIETLSIMANLIGKNFNDVFKLEKSIERKIEYCTNFENSIELYNTLKKVLCNLGAFIKYDKVKKLSDSKLKDFTYAITVKAYENKGSLVCPNPRGKKGLLEKFKNIKEKEQFYLTLENFMDKKNWSSKYYDTTEKD